MYRWKSCRFQSANTREFQSYFDSSPYPLFAYFALRVQKRCQILGAWDINHVIFDFKNGLEALPFSFNIFLCRRVHAIFAQLLVLKIKFGNLTSTVFTQFILEVKNMFLAHWVVFAVCNSRIMFLLVVVDLQILWPWTSSTAKSVRIFKNTICQGKMFVKRI